MAGREWPVSRTLIAIDDEDRPLGAVGYQGGGSVSAV